VVVLTGRYHQEYSAALSPLINANHTKVTENGALKIQLVHNPKSALGPFSSIQLGLQTLLPLDGDLLIQPLDVPVPLPAVSHLLLGLGLKRRARAMAFLPLHEGRTGHPVCLAPALQRRLLKLELSDPEARLDRQLQQAEEAGLVAHLQVEDPNVHENLNTHRAFCAWRDK